jgi:RimJ/RimL family protein N-acetyltransferase
LSCIVTFWVLGPMRAHEDAKICVMFSMSEVDDDWAMVFDSSREDLWRPGVAVTPHTGPLLNYRGVFLFKRGDACRVSAPPSLVEALRRKIERLDAGSAFGGEMLLGFLGDRVELVVGPNWYGYVNLARYRPVPAASCRSMTEADAPALASLRDSCSEGDWSEAAFDEATALFGYFDDRGELVAASNLTGWRRATDRIGVVTHPDRRGRGYGAAVAAAATAAALETTTVAEWRARGTNIPSIKTALRLGFVHYGENLAVRLLESVQKPSF